jgi:hypothetical protein
MQGRNACVWEVSPNFRGVGYAHLDESFSAASGEPLALDKARRTEPKLSQTS